MGKEKDMKHPQQSPPAGVQTTFVDVWRWGQELERLHARIAPRFARPEPRRRALAYLKGIVSATRRKNGWQLAEHAGESRPDGMQRLLNSTVWDADLVRDDLRTYILERFGDQDAVLVIDETSFRKRGKKSAGVKKQYCGTTGTVENCQVGVFLSYVSKKGYTLLICPRNGSAILGVAGRLAFQKPSAFTPNVSWPSGWLSACGEQGFLLPGSSPIACMAAIWICACGSKRMGTLTCWRWPAMNPWEYRLQKAGNG
jgi:hypothetical protein